MENRPLIVMFSGTRDLDATELVRQLVYELPPDTIVLHGGQGLVDNAVQRFAWERGLITGVFHANWRMHGKGGGPRRTLAMVQIGPDRVYVIWNGKSPGSKRAIEFAERYERELIEHKIERAS